MPLNERPRTCYAIMECLRRLGWADGFTVRSGDSWHDIQVEKDGRFASIRLQDWIERNSTPDTLIRGMIQEACRDIGANVPGFMELEPPS